MKRCIDCKRELPHDDFSRHAARPDGRNNVCRSCAADRQRAYRSSAKGREQTRAASRRYRLRLNARNNPGTALAA